LFDSAASGAVPAAANLGGPLFVAAHPNRYHMRGGGGGARHGRAPVYSRPPATRIRPYYSNTAYVY